MLNSRTTLQRIFQPASIVVVGASNDPRRIGGRPLRYLREHSFGGSVYAVNPKYNEVQGFPCYPDIASLPPGIDLAVLMLASNQVIEAVEACAAKGIAGVVVTASGFAEAGPDGRALQQRLREVARRTDIRIIGPNTVGFRNHNTSVFATFATDIDSGVRSGNMAIVAQSGGLGGYLGAAMPRDLGSGTRWMIDTGNEVDIDCAECLEYISREPGISVIGLIIEGCRDASALLEAIASARRRGIPVVVLKIGRSEAGAHSVQLHTGALSGEDRVWDAALAAAGAIRARDETHFIDLVRIFDMAKKAAGGRLGVVTLSGGVATVVLDAAERLGIEVPQIGPPGPDLKAKLPLVGFSNPLDASGQMANTPDALERLVDYMLEQDNIDVVIVWLAYGLLSNVLGPAMANGVARAAQRSDKPVIVCGMATTELRDGLAGAGVLVMPYPTTVVEALSDAIHAPMPAARSFDANRGRPVSGAGRILTGPQAEKMLEGLPFVPSTTVRDRAAAASAVEAIGGSAVLKAEVEGLAHKSELSLVRLNITSGEAASKAFDHLQRTLESHNLSGEIVVQPQLTGVELFLGASRDPVFGPVVTFGLGGIFVEIFKDSATLLAPCLEEEVLQALLNLKGWPILTGARGREAIDVTGFAGLVARFSRMVADQPDISGVDLNPVIATAKSMVAVDVVVTTTD